MKKRILFVINSMGCGGAEKSLLSLLSLLDYGKYDITLQMFHRGGMFEELLPQEVHIREELDYSVFCSQSVIKQLASLDFRRIDARLRTSLYLRRNAKRGYPLHDAQAYWRYASAAYDPLPEQYDIAIAWGQGTPTHFVAEKVRARRKIAWVNADYENVGHNKNFDRKYYAAFSKVACVSDKLCLVLKKVFPEYAAKMTTIYDINNPATVFTMASQPCLLPNREGLTLVTVGRLVPQKGYDIATKAAYLLKKRGVKFHWYVVGDGDRGAIEKYIDRYRINDCFTLLGAKANPYPYMKVADIYVQTSRFEGYCLTLAEARMLNIPCVTTNFDVVYAQMIDGENGLVVEMNAEAVADGIIRLATDVELYQHIKRYQEQEKKGNVEEIEKFYELMDIVKSLITTETGVDDECIKYEEKHI